MNNKPVAWAREDGVIAFHKQKEVDSQGFKWFPLYTHPTEHDLGIAEAIGFDKGYKAATAKTLTDEEIQDLWAEMDWSGQPELEFARAILRKAQE